MIEGNQYWFVGNLVSLSKIWSGINVCFISLLASQAWCLGRLFPLILLIGGVALPENDDNWMNFMLLLTILDHLLSPITSHTAMSYLKALINDHHQNFVKLHPSCNVIPKMHYLIHYPDWIVR